MKPNEISEMSARILLAHYAGDSRPFLDACHDDVLWIGPLHGQVVYGRANLGRELAEAHGRLRFSARLVNAATLPVGGPSACEVMFAFLVEARRPDGGASRVRQRVQLSWTGCPDEPRILLCHVSNAAPGPEDGRDAPEGRATSRPARHATAATPRLCLRGPGRTTVYLDAGDVLYVESKGSHALVHAASGTFEAAETVSAIARRYPEAFVRCHASYLVNPACVRGVARCRLTLADGTELPVPEKRFTAVRAELAGRMG